MLAVYIRIWAVANYLVANYPRIVVVGYNPSDLHGIRSGLIHFNHWVN